MAAINVARWCNPVGDPERYLVPKAVAAVHLLSVSWPAGLSNNSASTRIYTYVKDLAVLGQRVG